MTVSTPCSLLYPCPNVDRQTATVNDHVDLVTESAKESIVGPGWDLDSCGVLQYQEATWRRRTNCNNHEITPLTKDIKVIVTQVILNISLNL